MSGELFNVVMEESYIIDKTTTLDEYGSVKTVYKEGAQIGIAYSFDDSTESRIAEQEGVTNRYTLTTVRAVVLRDGDVVKRKKDGKYFQVTSDGDDNEPPITSSLNMRQVEAKEWELPNE